MHFRIEFVAIVLQIIASVCEFVICLWKSHPNVPNRGFDHWSCEFANEIGGGVLQWMVDGLEVMPKWSE
jgi:hypothetical protein